MGQGRSWWTFHFPLAASPSPPHFAPLYKLHIMKQFGYDVDAIQRSCPVAEEAFNHRFTHLPLYDYSDEQLKYMADAIVDAARELGG